MKNKNAMKNRNTPTNTALWFHTLLQQWLIYHPKFKLQAKTIFFLKIYQIPLFIRKKNAARRSHKPPAGGTHLHYIGRRQATHTPAKTTKKRTPTGVLISRASGATHHYIGRRQATHTPVDPPHRPTRRNRRDDRVMMTKKVGGDVNSRSRVSPDFQSQRTRGRAAPTRAPEKLFLNKFLPAGNQ